MQTPIFSIIHENGDLLIHSSVQCAEIYHEPYDLQEPVTIYDATGLRLEREIVNRGGVQWIQLRAAAGEPRLANDLAVTIRKFLTELQRQGKWRGADEWLATASLEALVREVSPIGES